MTINVIAHSSQSTFLRKRCQAAGVLAAASLVNTLCATTQSTLQIRSAFCQPAQLSEWRMPV